MKIVRLSLLFSVVMSFEALAKDIFSLKLPAIPFFETYKCSDKTERIFMYMETEKDVRSPGGAVVVQSFSNNIFMATSKHAPWSRFSSTFLNKETREHNFRGVIRGDISKTDLKSGRTDKGIFFNAQTEKGKSTTLMTEWNLERAVGAPQQVLFNGTKVTAYEIKETARHKTLDPISTSFLYAPSISTALKFTSDATGKLISCDLVSYTKLK